MTTSETALGPAWHEDYKISLCEDAHQLLVWGHADARPQFHLAKDEYDLTGFICEKMRARTEGPDERYWCYTIGDQHPVSPKGETGKRRKKLDIHVIEAGRRRYKPTFTFEAKRLRDDPAEDPDESLKSYLGSEGIRRFIDEIYAGDSDQAGMVGLIQGRDPRYWNALLTASFDQERASGRWQLSVVRDYCAISMIPNLDHHALSVHRRPSGRSIHMYHVLLDCRVGDSNASPAASRTERKSRGLIARSGSMKTPRPKTA